MNTLIHAKFISESFPILVNYEKHEDKIAISSIQLIRKVANSNQIYHRSPVYEASFIYNDRLKDTLSPAQLSKITGIMLSSPAHPVPAEQIVEI